MYVQNFRSVGQKLWPLRPGHTNLHTDTAHTDRRVRQENSRGNQNTWPGSVMVRIEYRLVKQNSLVISTGL